MSIIDRIRRIAGANLNHLLDKVDTPEMELRARIEELENAVTDARGALAGYAEAHKKMERERDLCSEQVKNWQVKAEEALRSGNEPVARHAVEARIKDEERLVRLVPMVDKSGSAYEELKQNIIVLSDQLKAARIKLSELQTRKRAAEARQAFSEKFDKVKDIAGRKIDYSSFEEEVNDREVSADVQQEVASEIAALDRTLDDLQMESQVDSELEALRKKLAKG
jgi:phage shock protein A